MFFHSSPFNLALIHPLRIPRAMHLKHEKMEASNFMMRAIVTIVTMSLFSANALAAGRTVKCEITTNGTVAYNGTCSFISERGGSFSLSGNNDKALYGMVTVISVTVIEKDVADVRGLTTDGINSRWGEAKRSQKDKACWVGADFKICAR